MPNGSGCARSEAYKQYILRTRAAAEYDNTFDEISDDSRGSRKRNKIDIKLDQNMPSKFIQYPNSIKLKVAKVLVPHQRCGVFAMETVEPNKIVVEFTGEIMRLDAAYTREAKYDEIGLIPNMFKFDDELVSIT